jgi:hypothetical protein
MIRTRLTHSAKLLACLLALTFSACAYDPAYNSINILREGVNGYNHRFESKLMESASPFVAEGKRGEFLADAMQVKEKVSFYEASIIDIKFYQDDQPIKTSQKDADEIINRAVVVLRYQLSILPSNSVKTVLIEQEWNRQGGTWFVSPDLKKYFE